MLQQTSISLSVPVIGWLDKCREINYRRDMFETIRLMELYKTCRRFEIKGKFKDWKHSCLCRSSLRYQRIKTSFKSWIRCYRKRKLLTPAKLIIIKWEKLRISKFFRMLITQTRLIRSCQAVQGMILRTNMKRWHTHFRLRRVKMTQIMNILISLQEYCSKRTTHEYWSKWLEFIKMKEQLEIQRTQSNLDKLVLKGILKFMQKRVKSRVILMYMRESHSTSIKLAKRHSWRKWNEFYLHHKQLQLEQQMREDIEKGIGDKVTDNPLKSVLICDCIASICKGMHCECKFKAHLKRRLKQVNDELESALKVSKSSKRVIRDVAVRKSNTSTKHKISTNTHISNSSSAIKSYDIKEKVQLKTSINKKQNNVISPSLQTASDLLFHPIPIDILQAKNKQPEKIKKYKSFK